MKVGIIINCVGYDENQVKLEEQLLKEVFPVVEKLGLEVTVKTPYSDWLATMITMHTNSLPLQDREEVTKRLKSDNKGLVVKNCIQEFKQQEVNFIVHIDGSLKFQLNDINPIIKIMVEPSVDAVLTKRDTSGMNKFRTVIEALEKKVIYSKFSDIDIQDGQSGFWSIRLEKDFDPDKNLTALGYGIELNILLNLLQNKRNIIWFPTKVTCTNKSGFNFSANIRKMKWLCQELSIRKEELMKIIEEFKKENNQKIEEAEQESKGLGYVENTFNNYEIEITKGVMI